MRTCTCMCHAKIEPERAAKCLGISPTRFIDPNQHATCSHQRLHLRCWCGQTRGISAASPLQLRRPEPDSVFDPRQPFAGFSGERRGVTNADPSARAQRRKASGAARLRQDVQCPARRLADPSGPRADESACHRVRLQRLRLPCLGAAKQPTKCSAAEVDYFDLRRDSAEPRTLTWERCRSARRG